MPKKKDELVVYRVFQHQIATGRRTIPTRLLHSYVMQSLEVALLVKRIDTAQRDQNKTGWEFLALGTPARRKRK
jgi:hypothetical protein